MNEHIDKAALSYYIPAGLWHWGSAIEAVTIIPEGPRPAYLRVRHQMAGLYDELREYGYRYVRSIRAWVHASIADPSSDLIRG